MKKQGSEQNLRHKVSEKSIPHQFVNIDPTGAQTSKNNSKRSTELETSMDAVLD